jgi:hypothetical protein
MGVVYDPPRADLTHLAVMFVDGQVVACLPVGSIDEGEAFLKGLMPDLPHMVEEIRARTEAVSDSLMFRGGLWTADALTVVTARQLPQRLLLQVRPNMCRERAVECRKIAKLPDTSPARAATLRAIANSLTALAGQTERLASAEPNERNGAG